MIFDQPPKIEKSGKYLKFEEVLFAKNFKTQI